MKLVEKMALDYVDVEKTNEEYDAYLAGMKACLNILEEEIDRIGKDGWREYPVCVDLWESVRDRLEAEVE